MSKKHYTSSYERQQHSKALVATNERELEKHKKQKQMARQVEDQQKHINRLEDEISQMREIMETLVENNK